MKDVIRLLAVTIALAVAGCGGNKSGGNNLGITGYKFEDVVGAMGENAKINDRYIASWPGFEILPGGGTRRMNLQMPATVDGFAVDPRATLIDVNASGQFLAELFLPDSPEYSEVAALLSEDAPIILPYPPGQTQRRPDQMRPNQLNAKSLNNAGQALVGYLGGSYLVSPSSIELANHIGVLAAGGMIFGSSPDGPPLTVPSRLVNGVPVPLFDPIDGLYAVMFAVSDSGTAVGTLSADPGDFSHPASIWIWKESEGVKFIPIGGGRRVWPVDVNDQGVVIGSFLPENPTEPGTKPFLIIEGRFVELTSLEIMPPGTFLGSGEGINNSNIISQDAGGLKIGRPIP